MGRWVVYLYIFNKTVLSMYSHISVKYENNVSYFCYLN